LFTAQPKAKTEQVQTLQKFAVLLMAYGTPSSEADIEAYLTDIRGGRRPTPEAVQDLRERYRKIGGRSPLLEITNAQTSALEKRLNTNGMNVRTYFGMKHWHPYIREVVPTVLEEGLDRIVGLVLAPHYSQISIGGYKKALDNALGVLERKPELTFIQSWYDNQIFHRAVEEKIQGALATLPNKAEVLFTAHSLPERILQQILTNY
jgi:ferrochelatase